MGGVKPHLMTGTRNNLGAETRVTYAPSTRFYLADEQAGRPWVTRLPFPVQVVERVETIDWIGRNRLVSRYAYHHGYFDGYEREFRGFGMVEQWDTEEFRADTAFADGDFVNWDAAVLVAAGAHPHLVPHRRVPEPQQRHPAVSERVLDRARLAAAEPGRRRRGDAPARHRRCRRARRLRDPARPTARSRATRCASRSTPTTASAAAANPYTVTEQNFTIRLPAAPWARTRTRCSSSSPREALAFHYERGTGDPRVGHEIMLAADGYGNVLRSVSIGYPRRPGYAPPEPALSAATQQMLAYDQARLHVTGDRARLHQPDRRPGRLAGCLPRAAALGERRGGNHRRRADGQRHRDHEPVHLRRAGQPLAGGVESAACDMPYEQIPGSDVDGSGSPAAAPTRRFDRARPRQLPQRRPDRAAPGRPARAARAARPVVPGCADAGAAVGHLRRAGA